MVVTQARSAGWKRPVAMVAAACMAGMGIGYVLWGWPTNWYAQRSIDKLPPGPERELIRYGLELVVDTSRHIGKSAADPAKRYAGNDLACTHCHLNGGLQPFAAPFVSTFATFPMMVNDQVLTLADRLNGCMTRSMNGSPLPDDSREMDALIAYIRFVGTDTPQAVRVEGMGLRNVPSPPSAPDSARGQQVYADMCAKCHKSDGQGERRSPPGVGYSIPPLWGDESFNSAAGMSNLTTAAAFIRSNMPYVTTYKVPMLTVQQAWDVAAFITTRPRPGPRAPQSTPKF